MVLFHARTWGADGMGPGRGPRGQPRLTDAIPSLPPTLGVSVNGYVGHFTSNRGLLGLFPSPFPFLFHQGLCGRLICFLCSSLHHCCHTISLPLSPSIQLLSFPLLPFLDPPIGCFTLHEIITFVEILYSLFCNINRFCFIFLLLYVFLYLYFAPFTISFLHSTSFCPTLPLRNVPTHHMTILDLPFHFKFLLFL